MGAVLAQTYLASWLRDYQPQARYLFPALGPIATLLMLGLTAWLPGRLPGGCSGRAALVGLPALLLALNLAALDVSVGRAFYSLEPPDLTLQIDTPTEAAMVGDATVTVGGWAVLTGGAPWPPHPSTGLGGRFTPVTVVLSLDGPPGAAPTLPARTTFRPDLYLSFGNDPAHGPLGCAAELPVVWTGEGWHTRRACANLPPRADRCRVVTIDVPLGLATRGD